MTKSYEVFRQAVERYGNNEVARRIGRSKTTVSQAYHGKYPNPENIYKLAAEAFKELEDGAVACQVLGNISAAVCQRFAEWSGAGKVHRDPNYRRVKEACPTCKMRRE